MGESFPCMFHPCKIMLFPWLWPTHGFHCYKSFPLRTPKANERRLKKQCSQQEGKKWKLKQLLHIRYLLKMDYFVVSSMHVKTNRLTYLVPSKKLVCWCQWDYCKIFKVNLTAATEVLFCTEACSNTQDENDFNKNAGAYLVSQWYYRWRKVLAAVRAYSQSKTEHLFTMNGHFHKHMAWAFAVGRAWNYSSNNT